MEVRMYRSSLVAIIGTLALTATIFAAPAKSPAKPKDEWATGQIARVDTAARSVVVKQGTHEMTFVLASDAQLMAGKKTFLAGDLANDIGRRVKVRYTSQSGTNTANRLEIVEAAPAKSTTAMKSSTKKPTN
jgi:hypothetical protein